MEITAIVIDEEHTFADALAIRLNTEEDIKVAAVSQLTAERMGSHADVVLLDADLAGSMRLCQATAGPPDETRVIMLSQTSEPSRIVAAIEAGARGWVRKDESIEHLLRVIRGVAHGETWLPPADTGKVLSLLLRQRDMRENRDRMLALLTPRERQVLACVAEGASRSQVAERLNLTANTVRTHLQNIMAKLGVHSTLEAVALTRAPSVSPAGACQPGTPGRLGPPMTMVPTTDEGGRLLVYRTRLHRGAVISHRSLRCGGRKRRTWTALLRYLESGELERAGQECLSIPDGNCADFSARRDTSSAAAGPPLRVPCQDFKATGGTATSLWCSRNALYSFCIDKLMLIGYSPLVAAFPVLSYFLASESAGAMEEIRWR